MISHFLKAILFLGVGAGAGAVLGYANQCLGGSCPLMCLWWRGAIFGSVAGLAIYCAGLTDKRTGRPAQDGAEDESGAPGRGADV
jgi:hypothetical protein